MSEFVFAQHAALLEKAKIRRQQAAAQIRHMRFLEMHEPDFVKDSSLYDYLEQSGGLLAFLNYSRSQESTVLEIGVGTANALAELASSQLGNGLSFVGTGLTHRRHAEVPNVSLRQTPAEILSGVSPKSVGGILSLNGIGFSKAPELVVDAIDRSLVGGGAIKATFRGDTSYGPEWDQRYDSWGYGSYHPFRQELRRRRYDVAVIETGADDILVALKPGFDKATSAQQLLEQDMNSLPDQLALIA